MMQKMQKTHEESVAALEEKVTESLELAEQIEADQDGNLDALRTQLAREHGEEADGLRARVQEAVQAAEAKEKEALELSEECDTLSAELKRVGGEARAAVVGLEEKLEAAEEARSAVEEALSETVAAVSSAVLSLVLWGEGCGGLDAGILRAPVTGARGVWLGCLAHLYLQTRGIGRISFFSMWGMRYLTWLSLLLNR